MLTLDVLPVSPQSKQPFLMQYCRLMMHPGRQFCYQSPEDVSPGLDKLSGGGHMILLEMHVIVESQLIEINWCVKQDQTPC